MNLFLLPAFFEPEDALVGFQGRIVAQIERFWRL